MPHLIGDKVWYKGDEVTITTEAFRLHGGLFQDATTEDGKTVTIATPEQSMVNCINTQMEWMEQQKQFSRLKHAK